MPMRLIVVLKLPSFEILDPIWILLLFSELTFEMEAFWLKDVCFSDIFLFISWRQFRVWIDEVS